MWVSGPRAFYANHNNNMNIDNIEKISADIYGDIILPSGKVLRFYNPIHPDLVKRLLQERSEEQVETILKGMYCEIQDKC